MQYYNIENPKEYGFYPEVTKLLTQNLYESRIVLVFSSNNLCLFAALKLATLSLAFQFLVKQRLH